MGHVYEKPKTGLAISSFIRETLMHKLHLPYERAQEIAEFIDNEITKADWLETFNGTTYTVSFRPEPKSATDTVEKGM